MADGTGKAGRRSGLQHSVHKQQGSRAWYVISMNENDILDEHCERATVDEFLKGPQPLAFFIDTDLTIEGSKQKALELLMKGWRIVVVVAGSFLHGNDFLSDPLGVCNRHVELLEFPDRVYWVDSFPYDALGLIDTFRIRCMVSDVEFWPTLQYPAEEVEDIDGFEVAGLHLYRRRD